MKLTDRYQIIETELGPVISESRTTVYDVMEAHDKGLDTYQICMTYNLTPLQVQTALDYIARHRARLEPVLREILRQAAEREAHYRAQAEAIRQQVAQEPPTPLRAAFNELREKNRQASETEPARADCAE